MAVLLILVWCFVESDRAGREELGSNGAVTTPKTRDQEIRRNQRTAILLIS